MPNPFVHIELSTDNTGKAKDFYAKLFDWKYDESQFPGGAYTMINTGGKETGAGLSQKQNPQAPNGWLAYVEVESVEKSVRKAKDLGAKILMDKTDIPNMGAFAILADPTGASIGIWESGKKK